MPPMTPPTIAPVLEELATAFWGNEEEEEEAGFVVDMEGRVEVETVAELDA